MIAIYLRPDCTQAVKGRMKKGVLNIQEGVTLDESFLPNISQGGGMSEEAVGLLCDMFEKVHVSLKGKRDEFYVVLPDYVFSMVDCFRFDGETDIRQHIESGIYKGIDDVSYAKPIITAPEPQQQLVTVCVLDKAIIDGFVKAAKEAHVQLASIESAGISFLRATGFFAKEELSLYSFENHATLIGYSSNGGLFKMDTPELSVSALGELSEIEAEQQIRQSMVEFENVAHQTFEYLNQDLPYTLMMPQDAIDKYPALLERRAELHEFSELVKAGNLDGDDEDWMCAVGTLLQGIDFNDDKFSDVLDSYESIMPGNVLPEEVKLSARRFQRFEDLTKYSKVAIAVLAFVAVAEGSAIGFLSNTPIPQGLQSEFQQAQSESESLNREMDAIKLAEKENEYPLEAYSALLERLPDGVNLTSLVIGTQNNADDAKWVKAKIYTADPLKFQDFVSSLDGRTEFGNVSIPQFTTDTSTGYKTADLTISKGHVGGK